MSQEFSQGTLGTAGLHVMSTEAGPSTMTFLLTGLMPQLTWVGRLAQVLYLGPRFSLLAGFLASSLCSVAQNLSLCTWPLHVVSPCPLGFSQREKGGRKGRKGKQEGGSDSCQVSCSLGLGVPDSTSASFSFIP